MTEKTPVDFIEAGQGNRVLLLHSSVSGAGQWRGLMASLKDRFHLIAPNLFGYGQTPPWQVPAPQTLKAQAELVTPLLDDADPPSAIVGHSYGGSVAMKAAAEMGSRVDRLVLIEPNPFFLLALHGRTDAYQEALQLRDVIKTEGAAGNWHIAAEVFADYWTGAGSWASMSLDRQAKFALALQPNFYEWDGVEGEETPLQDWHGLLPRKTTVIWSKDTVRTIGEICELMQDVIPDWAYVQLESGGHMSPMTRPDEVNAIIAEALT